MIVEDLLDRIDRDGGFTVTWPTLEPVTTGFAVGGVSRASTMNGSHNADRLRRWLLGVPRDVTVIGAWRDTDGLVWLDLVEVFASEGHATGVARGRGELAIFDLSTNKEIRL